METKRKRGPVFTNTHKNALQSSRKIRIKEKKNGLPLSFGKEPYNAACHASEIIKTIIKKMQSSEKPRPKISTKRRPKYQESIAKEVSISCPVQRAISQKKVSGMVWIEEREVKRGIGRRSSVDRCMSVYLWLLRLVDVVGL